MAKDSGGRKSRPLVISRHGKHRFQTGRITAALLERGLPMEDAVGTARAARRRVQGRAEITSAQLQEQIELVLEERGLAAPPPPPPRPEPDAPVPRHVLLRELTSVGLDVERAGQLAEELYAAWDRAGIGKERVAASVGVARAVLAEESEALARRYELLRWLRAADRPVVLLVGGATGTGKSTLAMELAFRLGIRVVVSTDMIREIMRMVLPAEVVPGLHDHSFRGILDAGGALSDPRDRVLAGFHQQAAQVAVGVNAVIRRAIREGSDMIVEGTHLVPPFQRYVPPGNEVYSAGMLLAVPAERSHRQRFPQRQSRHRRRDAAAYLDAFQSVRWIHDELLTEAEEHESMVIPTGAEGQTALTAMDFCAVALPAGVRLAGRRVPTLEPSIPTLFLILDGLSDEAHPALGGQTPLAAADTPWLDRLAGSGGQGRVAAWDSDDPHPRTDAGLWALLALDGAIQAVNRGVYEALGLGIPIARNTVYLRGNLATRGSADTLVDRRAGRIRAGVPDLLRGLEDVSLGGGIHGSVRAGHEHRVLVSLRGPGLSDAVSDTDPGDEEAVMRMSPPVPLDGSPQAARTAEALRELLDKAAAHLEAHPHNAERVALGLPPANCVICRGAADGGMLPPPVHTPDRAAIVAACHTAQGVGRLLGMRAVSGPAMTGNLDTDLDAKFRTADELLADLPYVVVHVKGTDIAAHDRMPLAKRDFISAIDAALGRFLKGQQELRVVVSADHGTSSVTGHHLADPVPVLVSMWDPDAQPGEFNETSAIEGALGVLGPGELPELILHH